MTYGALVIGSTHTLFEPGGGGVLGLRPGICHESALSCYPSFLDTMVAETGLPKMVTFCGNDVRGWRGGPTYDGVAFHSTTASQSKHPPVHPPN